MPPYLYVPMPPCLYVLCLYASMSYASMSLCLYGSMSLCLYASMPLCLYASMPRSFLHGEGNFEDFGGIEETHI